MVDATTVGARVRAAREAVRLTQEALAAKIGVDRTALSKIEAGVRSVSALELANLSSALRRSMLWFMEGDLPAIASHRASQSGALAGPADGELDQFARDIGLLVDQGALTLEASWRPEGETASVGDGERAAVATREYLDTACGTGDRPFTDLIAVAEALGVYVLVAECGEASPDGLYSPLGGGPGVAVINGSLPSGRRRFTLAHEIGHHLLSDEYSEDWHVTGDDESEKVINAFAIHLLMPRDGVLAAAQRQLPLLADDNYSSPS